MAHESPPATKYARPPYRRNFHIAIICALPLEYDAVALLVDEFWDLNNKQYGRVDGDKNTYRNGRIGAHNVVLMLLPNMGTAAMAGSAASLCMSYPALRIALLVGLCGGSPAILKAFLGDVVISDGVVQYLFGRQYTGGFVTKSAGEGNVHIANREICSLISYLKTELGRRDLQDDSARHLKVLQERAVAKQYQAHYEYPGLAEDKLFDAAYSHRHRGQPGCDLCRGENEVCDKAAQTSCSDLGCDESHLVSRAPLESVWNLIIFDEEENIVQFAHHTVREFLTTRYHDPEFNTFHLELKEADHFVGEICVTFLNFDDFKMSLTRLPKSVPRILPSDIARNALGLSSASKAPLSALRKFLPGSRLKNSVFDVVGSLASFNEEPITPMLKFQREHPFLEYASAYWLEHTRGFKKTFSQTWDLWQQMMEHGHGLAQFPWTAKALRFYFPDLSKQGDLIVSYPASHRAYPLKWAYTNQHTAIVWLIFHRVLLVHTDQHPDEIDILLLRQSIEWKDTLLLDSILFNSVSLPYLLETPEYFLHGPASCLPDPDFPRLNRGEGGFTALQSASSVGHEGVIERLLSAGANVHACGPKVIGRNALHFASHLGSPEVVKLLLAAGADVNAFLDPTNKGVTALHIAAQQGHVEVVQLLLEAGASVNAYTSPLYDSRRKGDPRYDNRKDDFACQLLKSRKIDEEGINGVIEYGGRRRGFTALHLAAANGSHEVVKVLIEAGAELDALTIGDAPSFTAVQLLDDRHYCSETARLLLYAGADPTCGLTLAEYYSRIDEAARRGYKY